jgi:hypothetical protein
VKLLVLTLLFLQPGPRAPLTPAETLLEPALLRAIQAQAPPPVGPETIAGTDAASEVVVTCADDHCAVAGRAIRRLSALVSAKTLPQPVRTIRLTSAMPDVKRTAAVVHVAERTDRGLQILRGLWSTAAVGDEVAEVFGRQIAPAIEVRPYEFVGQFGFDSYGIPTTTIVANPAASNDQAAVIAATTAYFLATLPNAGSEALLSHLMVGAHARLAEDGRKAVAMMGAQQRASGEVLTMFANAIDREQRRIASFERFMPQPVDAILHSRIADMQKQITGVWSSIGITPSPFVPPAERIRGRGGEDRRIPSRSAAGPLPKVDLPTAFLKFETVDTVVYELGNFVDGARSISDIRDAVSSEFTPIALPVVVEYFERLAGAGAISLK